MTPAFRAMPESHVVAAALVAAVPAHRRLYPRRTMAVIPDLNGNAYAYFVSSSRYLWQAKYRRDVRRWVDAGIIQEGSDAGVQLGRIRFLPSGDAWRVAKYNATTGGPSVIFATSFNGQTGAWGSAYSVGVSDVGTVAEVDFAFEDGGSLFVVYGQDDPGGPRLWWNRFHIGSQRWDDAGIFEAGDAGSSSGASLFPDADGGLTAAWCQQRNVPPFSDYFWVKRRTSDGTQWPSAVGVRIDMAEVPSMNPTTPVQAPVT